MTASTIIVVPCYNEAARLPVEDFRAFATREKSMRFLFVDDGSSDQTFEVIDAMAKSDPDSFSAMRLSQNMGKAEAVRRGMLAAADMNADFFGFCDADLATPLAELIDLRNVFRNRPETEMVFGARVNLLGRTIRRNLLRHYLGRVFATAAVCVIRVPIYDTQCGAKLFRVNDQVISLFREPFISRWIFDVEIVARLSQLRRGTDQPQPRDVIVEHPLRTWHDVAGSKVRYMDFFVVAMDLMRIHFRYMRKPLRRSDSSVVSSHTTP